MKKISYIYIFFIFSLSNCVQTHKHYTAEMTITPDVIESKKPAELTFQIKNPKGDKISDLEIVHEKPMHLFIVSDDLAQYFHEHPTKQNDGTYKVPFTFPEGGKYKVFVDFKPKDDEQTTESFDVDVLGERHTSIDLRPSSDFEYINEGIKVVMKPRGKLVKQQDLMLDFQVFDANTNEPVNDLQNYLGAKAHFVIIRKGLNRFVHAHPMTAEDMQNSNSPMKMETKDSESKVSAMVNFPNSGIYKIFAQFKRNNKVITVSFVFKVSG